MKKILILSGALLALTAGIASASSGVVNLSWNDCGSFGTPLRVNACNSNTGTNILYGSYTSFVALDSLNGNEIVIDMQTAGPTLSPWWQVKNYSDATVACRNGAGSIDFNFTTSTFNCNDYWNGQALGSYGVLRNFGGNNRQRILGVCAIGLSSAGPLDSNVETYSFKFAINNTKTTGTGACSGCADAALIVLNSILCTQNPGVLGAMTSQGGGNQINADQKMETLGTFASFQAVLPGAPGPTPTKNTTWGAVKSLYR